MSFLLDTHVLIYIGCGMTEQIGNRAIEAYADPETPVYVSQISFWEMAIKINIGKLQIPIGLENVLVLSQQAGIQTIPVKNDHILSYQSLQVHETHKDPFDRYLVATAISEKLNIISSDLKFDLYDGITPIWD